MADEAWAPRSATVTGERSAFMVAVRDGAKPARTRDKADSRPTDGPERELALACPRLEVSAPAQALRVSSAALVRGDGSVRLDVRAPRACSRSISDRRRLPCPQLERRGALVDEHDVTVLDALAPAAAASRSSRVSGRRVQQVQHEQFRRQQLRWDGRLVGSRRRSSRSRGAWSARARPRGPTRATAWRAAPCARRCGRSGSTRRLRTMEVAVEHDDVLEATR